MPKAKILRQTIESNISTDYGQITATNVQKALKAVVNTLSFGPSLNQWQFGGVLGQNDEIDRNTINVFYMIYGLTKAFMLNLESVAASVIDASEGDSPIPIQGVYTSSEQIASGTVVDGWFILKRMPSAWVIERINSEKRVLKEAYLRPVTSGGFPYMYNVRYFCKIIQPSGENQPYGCQIFKSEISNLGVETVTAVTEVLQLPTTGILENNENSKTIRLVFDTVYLPIISQNTRIMIPSAALIDSQDKVDMDSEIVSDENYYSDKVDFLDEHRGLRDDEGGYEEQRTTLNTQYGTLVGDYNTINDRTGDGEGKQGYKLTALETEIGDLYPSSDSPVPVEKPGNDYYKFLRDCLISSNTISGRNIDQASRLSACRTRIETLEETVDVGNDMWYGIEWTDSSIASNSSLDDCSSGGRGLSDPEHRSIVWRIGNPALHLTLPIQNQMRGCVLNEDGTVNYYLYPYNWNLKENGETAILYGTDGQVMVEIPEFYYKFETSGTTHRAMISQYPLAGFKKWAKCYVSAYQATIDRTLNQMASVRTYDLDSNDTDQLAIKEKYRGGNNDSTRDGTDKDQLGMCFSNIAFGNMLTYARRNRSVEWNSYLYQIHKRIFWLFSIEYCTFHCQSNFETEVFGEKQTGGLGPGVTGLTNWPYNNYYPVVPCGVTDSLGNKSGTVDYTIPAGYWTSGVATIQKVPRYRGIENPFGHIWTVVPDAMVLDCSATGTYPSETRLYVCDNPATCLIGTTAWSEAQILAAGYRYVGNIATSNGYGKSMLFGEDGDIFPVSVGGGANTYMCDYYYQNKPSSGNATRAVAFGGAAGGGSRAGFACADVRSAPSSSGAFYGSRLCHL